MCINCFCDKKVSKSFFRLSRNFSDHQDRKVSTLSKNFPGCPKTIQKISRLSGNFTGYQQLSGPSGKYPDYPKTFQAIRKLSGPSGNFPDGLETSQCNFKGYAQKLSGRAKTFRMAMPRCHDGFWASGAHTYWEQTDPANATGQCLLAVLIVQL